MGWSFMHSFLTGLYAEWDCDLLWSPQVSWWAPVWRLCNIWCDMAGMISTRVRVSWSTPMWHLLSICGNGTVTLICCVCTCPGDGVRSWPGAVPGRGFHPVMLCRCTWGWYLMWTIHYYMSIFITLEATYIWAMSCYMAWFLTLETAIFFMGHDIYCWWWY